MSLAFDSWSLGVEASLVIAKRMPRLAMMDSAAIAEAQLMVSEKVAAAAQLQLKAMTGGLGSSPVGAAAKSVSHYRKAVGKNNRRLSSRKR